MIVKSNWNVSDENIHSPAINKNVVRITSIAEIGLQAHENKK